MREIKFRGMMTPEAKSMSGQEVWAYGEYFTIWKNGMCQHYIMRTHETNKVKHWSYSREIIPETIGRFTGSHDKNNREIYEGEILKCHLQEIWNYYDEEPSELISPGKIIIGDVRILKSSGVRLCIKKIIFPNNDWDSKIELELRKRGIITKCAQIGSYIRIRNTDEIIGNIHENPELLETL